MRHLTLPVSACILTLLVAASCRSQKQTVCETATLTDSISHSENHRTLAVIDSAVRSLSFDFDTLEVHIERPSAMADIPETVRLRAVKGRVRDTRRSNRESIEHYNTVDSVAFRQSAVSSSAEHSATTRLYNPPSGTAVAIVAVLVAGLIIFISRRNR